MNAGLDRALRDELECCVEVREFGGGHRVAVLGGGEAASADVLGKGRDGSGHVAAQVRVAFDEARLEVVEDPEEVVEDKYLAVGRGSRANADCGDSEVFGYGGGNLPWHRLEHEGEATGGFQRERVVEELVSGVGAASLCPIAAIEGGCRPASARDDP